MALLKKVILPKRNELPDLFIGKKLMKTLQGHPNVLIYFDVTIRVNKCVLVINN